MSSYAGESPLKKVPKNSDSKFIVRLSSGDLLSGKIVDFVDSGTEGEGIKLKTEIGTATIYASQIVEIEEIRDYNRQSHRVFLMPTAEPIRNNHFIGAFQLLFLYAGAGIGDVISITAGRTIVPIIPGSDQISLINFKATVYKENNDATIEGIKVAIGGNYAWLGSANPMLNLYTVGTFTGEKTAVSAMIFAKTNGADIMTLRAGSIGETFMTYTNGTFGAAVGIDTKLTSRNDLRAIVEIWNNDLNKPQNTAFALGIRLANSSVSADFGLALFTQPFIIPFTSFSWTPF